MKSLRSLSLLAGTALAILCLSPGAQARSDGERAAAGSSFALIENAGQWDTPPPLEPNQWSAVGSPRTRSGRVPSKSSSAKLSHLVAGRNRPSADPRTPTTGPLPGGPLAPATLPGPGWKVLPESWVLGAGS